MNNVSLYIHIPFCIKKCAYCAFFSVCRPPQELITKYFDALKAQLKLIPKQTFSTVYLGGGTPTYAGSYLCADLLCFIDEHHFIDVDAEITVEANPDTVTASDFKVLRNAGFNRLSLGLQSANDNVLSAMGRTHTVNSFLKCYNSAMSSGIDNISVDMIFGLPKEFGDGFYDTVNTLYKIDPKHISAYSLSVESGTLLFKNRNRLTFPNEDEEDAQYSYICDSFSKYEHYEISSFAKTGYKSRHNSAYWNLTPYIGIGAGAHSFFDGKRFSYPCDISEFIKNSYLPFGNSDYNTAQPLTASELDEERIMLGLRTSEGAYLNNRQKNKAAISVRQGLAKFIGDRLILNERGYRVSNEIIAEILS